MSIEECPLCGRKFPNDAWLNIEGSKYRISCKQCGTYFIEATTSLAAAHWLKEQKAALSCAARQASENGSSIKIDADNRNHLAEAHMRTRVSENMDKLLLQIAKRANNRPSAGASLSLKDDFTLIDCFSRPEFDSYVEWILSEELALRTGAGPDSAVLTLSMKGWTRVQPLPHPGGISGRCFVAMWFHDETQAAYERGIEPAIESAIGKKPVRIDQKEHNNEITDEIMSEIRDAQFVVADFTGQRPGVYYEAGFALGLGRPVIFSCREDDFAKVHFDTNHRNHIVWQTPEDLQKKLYDRIRATILHQR